jgi:hypothetical protein
MLARKTTEMNKYLVTIQSLVDAYGSESEAKWFRSLAKTYGRNRSEFWREFGTNEVWGGSGSFLDQFMASPAGRDMSVFLSDQRSFHEAMVALAKEMISAGHRNAHAEALANATKE